MEHSVKRSVKYAKVSCERRNKAILRFSTKLVEMTIQEKPSYATALRLAEALKDLGYALEACHEGNKAGNGFEYVLEMRICKDTVSHQLTRDGNAAEGQLPSLHTDSMKMPMMLTVQAAVQAIIKFASSICTV